jgi:hypothetical protein
VFRVVCFVISNLSSNIFLLHSLSGTSTQSYYLIGVAVCFDLNLWHTIYCMVAQLGTLKDEVVI